MNVVERPSNPRTCKSSVPHYWAFGFYSRYPPISLRTLRFGNFICFRPEMKGLTEATLVGINTYIYIYMYIYMYIYIYMRSGIC
jgi:hypothetical protein